MLTAPEHSLAAARAQFAPCKSVQVLAGKFMHICVAQPELNQTPLASCIFAVRFSFSPVFVASSSSTGGANVLGGVGRFLPV